MHKGSRFRWIYISAALLALSIVSDVQPPAKAQATSPAPNVRSAPVQIHALKVTLLSTMLVGSTTGLVACRTENVTRACGLYQP